VVKRNGEIIGIAPLLIQGSDARFIGHSDVCDYLDFIVAPGKEKAFFKALVKYFRQQGITHLDLRPLRSDSSVLTSFFDVAQTLGCKTSCEPEDVSWEMALPATWDEFLGNLTGKQRHEIRRKLRRLEKAIPFKYRIVEDVDFVREEMNTFFDLFRKNREDKAAFMTPRLRSFFRSLAEAMAEVRILKLFFLELNGTPAAAVMCFDYGRTRYLYNNGYDQQFKSLSVGVLSKVLNIKDGTEKGIKVYDFLKGSEDYKHHLGGKPVQLHRCRIRIE